ncbi:hypothetical protein [Actinomyces qiguomingii]|uniref:hypothetical protein n=1 Tax=Actinomyces qiguomingii TaxID=2057800 RepID=UPI003A0FBC14
MTSTGLDAGGVRRRFRLSVVAVARRAGQPSSYRGKATFSAAVRDDSRLKSWKTKPMARRATASKVAQNAALSRHAKPTSEAADAESCGSTLHRERSTLESAAFHDSYGCFAARTSPDS